MSSKVAEFLGFEFEMYCSGQENVLDNDGNYVRNHFLKQNNPASYLGADMVTDRARCCDGRVFITGRHRKEGTPLTSQQLYGIIMFSSAAMSLPLEDKYRMVEWKAQYKAAQWPLEHDDSVASRVKHVISRAGVDIYCSNARAARCVNKHTED